MNKKIQWKKTTTQGAQIPIKYETAEGFQFHQTREDRSITEGTHIVNTPRVVI